MKLIDIIRKIDIDAIIIDFDNTITTLNSSTSIGVFTNYYDENYKNKKKILDQQILECNDDKELKKLWYSKIKLLEKYYDSSILDKVKKKFRIRKYFFKIYNYCILNNISIIICSSGFKPLIKTILDDNSINQYILFANDFETKSKDIIHSNNKNIVTKKICESNIIVGDQISDLSMCNKNTVLKIGIDINKKFNSYFDYIIH